MTEALLGKAQNDSAFSDRLKKTLGLPANADWNSPEVKIKLAQYVQGTLAQSPEVGPATKAFENQLKKGDIRYFNSAGNSGALQAELEAKGFKFDARFAGNAQSQAQGTESVGAGQRVVDANGKTVFVAPSEYSQRSPTKVMTDGVANVTVDGVPVLSKVRPGQYQQGTSFAAPRAGGEYSVNPKAYENLKKNALPVGNGGSGGYVDFGH